MAIEFRCSCGAMCSAEESQIGQLVHCEACGLDVPVPAPGAAAPPDADAAPDAAVVELGDLEQHEADSHEMVVQVEEATGRRPDGDAAKHREDLGALQSQVSPDVDPKTLAEKRRQAALALQEQLGSRGGIAEMADQMRGAKAEKGAALDGGAEAATAALGARPKRPPAKRPPKGKQRAAHHIGFKRFMWMPSLLVGLVCLGIGVYCFIPGGSNPYQRHLEHFQKLLDEAGIKEFMVVKDNIGRSWAIPKSATPYQSSTGKMWFRNVPAYGENAPDEAAVAADDYVESQVHQSGQHARYLGCGVGLVAVGLVLGVLSLWMLHDVRMVGGQKAPGEEPAGPVPPPSEPVTADAEATEAGEGGEPSEADKPSAGGEPRPSGDEASEGDKPSAGGKADEVGEDDKPAAADEATPAP